MTSPVPAARPADSTVLIVGAGPTGLALANILARYGVAVRLIEKRAALSRHTKATNLMQRTQELLDSVDLLEPLHAIGGAMSALTVNAYGASLGPRTMHLTESAFPDVILCGQDALEAEAAAGLARAGVDIEFGAELVKLDQDDDGCVAEIARDGRRETIRAAYVVGADGHAGVTRSFTSLDFTPVRTGVAIRQVDCTLRWHRSSTMDQMWMFYFDRGFSAVVPLPGAVHRVILIEPKDAFPEREPTLAEM
jgi:2-polyprenyl-6-methoxyphenol hydroxylase-like FAD-dependent oxidoreductase